MREFLAGAFCTILLAGCTLAPRVASPVTAPVIIPAQWSYERNAISLHIKADRHLNLFQNRPHALTLCIYHLRDPNAFNQLVDERGGLQKLLDCGKFDPSVLYARQVVVQPGQEMAQLMDRSEGAKFIAIAAGYYKLQKDRATRSFSVPVAEESRAGTVLQVPQKVLVDLLLGAQGMLTAPQSQQVRK